MKKLILLLILAAPIPSFAEELCEPIASIRPRAMYCDDNWAFLAPAQDCVNDYQQLLNDERARVEKMLTGRVNGAAGTAQNLDYDTTQKMLHDALDELTYLIDYGKQVHTELEDYGYGLVLPIYTPEEAKMDPSNPEVHKMFMDRECLSDPVGELDRMESQVRPMIDDLEKTKAKVLAMMAVTTKRDNQIQNTNSNSLVKGPSGAGSARTANVPKGTSQNKGSTITGEIKPDRLPSSPKK